MIIHYEKQVHDYLTGLTTRLRKFTPSEDFLDLWVHDEDPAASILNMLEAAGTHGLRSMSINITDEDTMRNLDTDRLLKSSEDIGKVSMEKTKEGLLVHVDFNHKQLPLASLKMTDIPVLYRARFSCHTGVPCFNRMLTGKPPLVLVSVSDNDITLQAQINPDSHTVEDLGYTGTITAISNRLMDELCALMRGKPIDECHDHSVIYLEYLLRDKSQKRMVVGITTPFNTWVIFADLTLMVRNLVHEYRQKMDYKGAANFYAPAVSSKWVSLSEEGKKEALMQSMRNFCQEHALELDCFDVKETQHHYKVILDMHPEICRLESTLLLELEVYLREHLEQTLCVHREEEPDQNKMRWDKPGVKSQIAVPKVKRVQV